MFNFFAICEKFIYSNKPCFKQTSNPVKFSQNYITKISVQQINTKSAATTFRKQLLWKETFLRKCENRDFVATLYVSTLSWVSQLSVRHTLQLITQLSDRQQGKSWPFLYFLIKNHVKLCLFTRKISLIMKSFSTETFPCLLTRILCIAEHIIINQSTCLVNV
jgi:hypothetical protein